jgi:NADH dehydrogenase
VAVQNDFSVPGHPECFVVGDAADVIGPDGRPVPGLASIAQQQGRYVGDLIAARLSNNTAPSPPEPFVPSKLATITRHVGIAEFGGRAITGFPAWLMWGLLHLRARSDGHARVSILANWLRLLISYRRSARLIIEHQEFQAFSQPHSAADLGDRNTTANEASNDNSVRKSQFAAFRDNNL